jgi:hypothetical protein
MKTIILSFFLMAIVLYANAQTIDIYVSPEGNDNNSGRSSSQPVASLQQALNIWEGLKKAGNTPPVVNILLKGGSYTFTQPVILNPNNGGSATTQLIIRSADQRAYFNGAKKISGWKKYKDNIWMARVPEAKEGKWMFNQLFINGRQGTVARFPNQGYYYVAGFPDGGEEVDYHTDSKRFQFKKGDINPDWKNIRDIRVIVYHFWSDAHLQMETIDPKTNIVTFKHPAEKRFTDDFSNEGARYIVENVFEGLDSPGEWFLDRYKGMVYYIPLPGEKMETAELMAPVSNGFIRFEGDPLSTVVENVRIEDISFEYSNFILPEDDGNDMQASMSVPASITATGASGITFSNCSFSNLGNFAFDLQKGCSNITIDGNRMEHLAAGAIKINGGTEKNHPLQRTRNIRISDNEIIHYGEKYPSAVAILLMNAEGCYIGHNHIFDGWYTGISVGWQWGYQRSITRDNIIEYNHIHQIGQGLLSDMGGIYTLGVSPGTIIRNNLVHDIESNKYGGWGIYNDEGSTHILIENNVVYNTKYAAYDIHYAKELTVRNNIFALGRLEELNRGKAEPHQSVFFENNIIYWTTLKDPFTGNWKDQPYTFHQNPNIAKQPTFTSTFDSDYNLFWNPLMSADSLRFNGITWKEWSSKGKDVHSLIADPMFIDPQHFDFRLSPNSPAYNLGFRDIDMRDVGPHKRD